MLWMLWNFLSTMNFFLSTQVLFRKGVLSSVYHGSAFYTHKIVQTWEVSDPFIMCVASQVVRLTFLWILLLVFVSVLSFVWTRLVFLKSSFVARSEWNMQVREKHITSVLTQKYMIFFLNVHVTFSMLIPFLLLLFFFWSLSHLIE